MQALVLLIVALMLHLIHASTALALSAEELIKLKEAGVSERTIQLYIQLEMEKLRRGPGRAMGRREVVGPDGKKRIIYYAIEDPERVQRCPSERDEKQRRSWKMLEQLVIDARGNERGEK